MDPKEYAARLQRMQDEIETAKARERIQQQSSRELSPDTNRDIEAAMAALREDKAASKPKAKPAAKKPAPAKKPAAQDVSQQESRRGKRGRIDPEQGMDTGGRMSQEDYDYYHGYMKTVNPMTGERVHVMPERQLGTRMQKLVNDAIETGKITVTPTTRGIGLPPLKPEAQRPAPTINAVRDTVKPPAAKLSPAQERVKGLTPAQAETILSDAYSTRGKHGQYTPEEVELMDALRAKAADFDYGKASQAPTAYVPSFLGGKK